MQKLLYIAPHLSTGGLPQYLTKKIELLQDEFDIYLVEYTDFTGGKLVVQKNKILNLIPKDKFYTLQEDKMELIKIIKEIQPDIIHSEEIPEFYMDEKLAQALYSTDRKYIIIESSHDSSFDTTSKRFFPDKFMFVSNWQIEQYKDIDIPKILVEYPIDYVDRPNREDALKRLDLDPNKKHILHIGLFTSRKNQKEFFEYAKSLPEYEFHSVGNQADNFKWYWEPLMKDIPDNLTWWNERTDVENFYQSMDLFLFTSRGTANDKETMPLVIREALSYQIPQLLYNLEVYQDYFDKYDSINYLNFDNFNENVLLIKDQLSSPKKGLSEQEAYVVSTYPINSSIEKTTIECLKSLKQDNRIIITTSHTPVSKEIQELSDYVIYDNNNILTNHTFGWWYNEDNKKFKVNFSISNTGNSQYHGPSCHTNFYNASNLCKKLGINKFYGINYDYHLLKKENIDELSKILDDYDMVTTRTLEGNGDTPQLFTAFFGARVDNFTKNQPFIENAYDWDKLQRTYKTPSNGMECLWYHILENNSKIFFESKKNWNRFMDDTFLFVDYSQCEYFSVIPVYENIQKDGLEINNPTNNIAIFLKTSNKKDNRIFNLKIYEGENLIEEEKYEITTYFSSYKILPESKYRLVLEIYDINSNKIIEVKEIIIDQNYLENILPKNGKFALK